VWKQQARFTVDGEFGDVAISKKGFLIVGVQGAVHVYKRNKKDHWKHQQTFQRKDEDYGSSVSISGNYFVVSSTSAVYVYHLDSRGTWEIQARIVTTGGGPVTIAGNYLVVANEQDCRAQAFHRYGYKWTEHAWLLTTGCSGTTMPVAIAGTTVLVGDSSYDGNGKASGVAHLFDVPH
jgi:hypothetical protein